MTRGRFRRSRTADPARQQIRQTRERICLLRSQRLGAGERAGIDGDDDPVLTLQEGAQSIQFGTLLLRVGQDIALLAQREIQQFLIRLLLATCGRALRAAGDFASAPSKLP